MRFVHIKLKNEKKISKFLNFYRALAICDPESDEEPINNLRNNHFNRKKLSYSDKENSSSSTSEFDPEDIIHPKTVIKKRKCKIYKINNFIINY